MVITIGANKHTNKAGNEGPIIFIAEYWAKKKNETPEKLAKMTRTKSFLEYFPFI